MSGLQQFNEVQPYNYTIALAHTGGAADTETVTPALPLPLRIDAITVVSTDTAARLLAFAVEGDDGNLYINGVVSIPALAGFDGSALVDLLPSLTSAAAPYFVVAPGQTFKAAVLADLGVGKELYIFVSGGYLG